jgi:YD repeat-containing protein
MKADVKVSKYCPPLAFLIAMLCTSTYAETYKWKADERLLFFATPHESCADWTATKTSNAVYDYQNWRAEYIGIGYGGVIFSCKVYNKKQKIYIGSNAVRRYGDFCAPNTSYNEITGECTLDPQKGPPNTCNSAGNPINFAIGNKFQSEGDYSSGSSSALNFTRSYNSLDGLWRHSFSTYLRFAGAQYVSVVMHHGRESFFTISGTTVTPTSADLGVLSKIGATGWQYVSTDNERFTFDTAGKLTRWSNVRGAVHQFAYAGNQVTITDNLGNSLTFTEDANKQPLTLTAPGVQINYGYNANKRLTSVTRVMGGQTTQRQFHYEDPRNNAWLTGITDERGVRYATWSYDDKGRAISSEHADGADKVTVAYNADGTVSVTNELGKVAKYSFQYIKGVRRITSIQGEPSANCPNSNSTFTYDNNGLLKTKTDNKGVLTTYTYNARGLEISRTEASGTQQARTITTDWHPTLFLPTVVTEPKRITTYHYDDQGRELSRTVEER